MQVLFWDFTNTLPDKINNQQYYVKDLPSKFKEKTKIEINGLAKGNYNLEVYKVGYKQNDVFTDYLAMNKPNQLTKEQVKTLKQKNNGEPFFKEKISIDAKGKFTKNFDINENDVFLLVISKQ